MQIHNFMLNSSPKLQHSQKAVAGIDGLTNGQLTLQAALFLSGLRRLVLM